MGMPEWGGYFGLPGAGKMEYGFVPPSRFPGAGSRNDGSQFPLSVRAGELRVDDNIDAPVFGPSFGSLVVGDGIAFSESAGFYPRRIDLHIGEQILAHSDGPFC